MAKQKIRWDASARLAERNRTMALLAAVPPPVHDEDSTTAIRANHRDEEERRCLCVVLVGHKEAILEINETLTNNSGPPGNTDHPTKCLDPGAVHSIHQGTKPDAGAITCPQPKMSYILETCSAGHQAIGWLMT